ncbi:hypothetical protein SK128_000037 [Halocaridina rubra]|uniref:Uncharacterized protein n=1 Tax=Halocaridina rubra TaxID=373956 RepID=A0AAN8XU43_HALRR
MYEHLTPSQEVCVTVLCGTRSVGVLMSDSARHRELTAKHPAANHEQSLEALQAKGDRYDRKKYTTPTWIQARAETTFTRLLRGGRPVHSAPENLTKPCTIRAVELALVTEAAKKMKNVPMSNDVTAGRAADMSCDILA